MNYDDWESFFNNLNFTYFRTSLIQKKYIETIEEYAKKQPRPRVLEIAAGSAYTSVVVADLLRKDGGTVMISDLSPELVHQAESKFGGTGNVYFSVQDSNDITLKISEVDIIIHQGFLEHFEDDQIIDFLKEQGRVARWIIFDVPNSLRNDKTQEFGNERFLHPKEWCELVRRADLTVHKITGRRFNNWWKKYVPTAVRDTEWFQRTFGESTIIVCGA